MKNGVHRSLVSKISRSLCKWWCGICGENWAEDLVSKISRSRCDIQLGNAGWPWIDKLMIIHVHVIHHTWVNSVVVVFTFHEHNVSHFGYHLSCLVESCIRELGVEVIKCLNPPSTVIHFFFFFSNTTFDLQTRNGYGFDNLTHFILVTGENRKQASCLLIHALSVVN